MSEETIPTLVLLDAPNLVHRAYHAVLAGGGEFSAPSGQPTGALMAYGNMAIRCRGLFPQAAFAAAWESPGSFRKGIYPDYKATRPPTPDALRSQMSLARALSERMGMPSLAAEGFEADDMLCAAAARAQAQGWRVVIATGDKDMAQAVTERVSLWHPASKTAELLGRDYVAGKFGVEPSQIAEYLALVGDTSDNIPGVEKIGPKTAATLLGKHGSVAGILEALEKLTPSQRANFEKAKATLPISLELARARLDAPLPLEIGQIPERNEAAEWAAAIGMAKELGMEGLVGRLERAAKAAPKQTPRPSPQAPEKSGQLRLF